jgi:hypothetical protein
MRRPPEYTLAATTPGSDEEGARTAFLSTSASITLSAFVWHSFFYHLPTGPSGYPELLLAAAAVVLDKQREHETGADRSWQENPCFVHHLPSFSIRIGLTVWLNFQTTMFPEVAGCLSLLVLLRRTSLTLPVRFEAI